MENMEDFILWWNITFPFDYLWRKKYNIAFNSPQHRTARFLDMKLEYEEEKIIKELIDKREQRREDLEEYNLTGKYLKERVYDEMSEEEAKDWFEKIDIAELNKNNPKFKELIKEDADGKNDKV